jgi:hypothetical protein
LNSQEVEPGIISAEEFQLNRVQKEGKSENRAHGQEKKSAKAVTFGKGEKWGGKKKEDQKIGGNNHIKLQADDKRLKDLTAGNPGAEFQIAEQEEQSKQLKKDQAHSKGQAKKEKDSEPEYSAG